MDLLVDFLALVDIGAVIGERRLDGVVRERMEHDAPPQHLRRRLLREAGDLLGVLPPQLAVDDEELREVVALGLDLGRAFENRRHDAIEELVVERDPALLERLRERAVVEVGARGVAGRVAREDAHRRVDVLVVEQREERDADRRVGDLDAVDRRARRRVSRILDVADDDARLDIVRRGAIDDELGAAEIDVVVRRDDRHARPFEPDLHVVASRVDSSVRMPRSTGRPAVTMIRAAPAWRSGTVCLPISCVMRTLSVPSCVICALPGSSRLKSVVCLPFCSKTTRSGFIVGASGAVIADLERASPCRRTSRAFRSRWRAAAMRPATM